MLKKGILTAAYNISGFVLLLGGFYFIDGSGLKSVAGYLYVLAGILCFAYIFIEQFINKSTKIPSYLLLYVSALCMFSMSLWRLSIENWEVPVFLLLLAAFIVMCALQLHGKKKFFPA